MSLEMLSRQVPSRWVDSLCSGLGHSPGLGKVQFFYADGRRIFTRMAVACLIYSNL